VQEDPRSNMGHATVRSNWMVANELAALPQLSLWVGRFASRFFWAEPCHENGDYDSRGRQTRISPFPGTAESPT
jgi:hypothetical protein